MASLWIGFLLFLLIGCVVGFLSGLLGVGGGVIIVPFLTWIFTYYTSLGIPSGGVMHVAIGTSLATMIITALAAIFSHQAHGNIDWKLYLKLTPGTIVGVIFGSLIAILLKTSTLSIIFGVLLLLVALYIFFSAKQKQERGRPIHIHWLLFSLSGLIIGVCSGLLGIGGGTLVIPFLLLLHYPVTKVAGTSVTVVLPLAVVGTISFMILGNRINVDVPYSTGFIYWPAFFGVSIGSVLLVYLGTKVGKHANKVLLKRFFSIILILIAIEMLIGS